MYAAGTTCRSICRSVCRSNDALAYSDNALAACIIAPQLRSASAAGGPCRADLTVEGWAGPASACGQGVFGR
jgi:hypothetical protein